MIEIKNKSLEGMKFIDLFAGLGGFRLALESYGAKCVYSNEWNKNVQQVYYNNFGDIPDGDITKVNEVNIPNHDILCAGFPCQAFSISGKQLGFEDSRGTLFFDVARIIKAKKPKVVLLENVKNFASHDNGRTLTVIKNVMDELGYHFFEKILAASDYGVPQKRERIYMVGFRKDLNLTPFEFPKPIKLTKFVEDILLPDSHETEALYVNTNELNIREFDRDKYVSKPFRVGEYRTGGQGERVYWIKGTAITLSAFGGGLFAKTGGYLMADGRVRKLHPRECARLMGFPDTYIISKSKNQAYQQFGNSVVVDVLQHICGAISETLKK